jgi:hypothetical protein
MADIALPPVEDHLVHQTAQQRLALCARGPLGRPDFRQTAGEADDIVAQRPADRYLRDTLLRALAGNRLLGDTNLVQRCLPPTL